MTEPEATQRTRGYRASWLDRDPPANPSLAAAYWCEMNYFLAHTSSGDHPPCSCSEGKGHNDPNWRPRPMTGSHVPGAQMVPCDSAAIERATDALLEDSGLPRWGAYRSVIERRVCIAFTAAGKVPAIAQETP